MASNSFLVAWLNDAHAMEAGIVEALERQVDLAADHPQVQTGIQQHLEATRRHQEMVAGCLEQLGEKPSTVKDVVASMSGKVGGMMPGGAKDDLVKAAINDYATEHMEIASYTALASAAHQAGEAGIAAKCEQILAEEQAMARWLEEHMPVLVQEAVVQGET